MEDLKKAWKQTAKSLIILASDLGTSLFKTAQVGVNAAVEWAKKDNPRVQTEGQEVCEEPSDEDAAEDKDETV